MHDLIVPSPAKLPTSPRDAVASQARIEAIIQFAAKVQDWPLLLDAIDAKIEDQREFVQWWDETVRPAGQGKEITQYAVISRADAEDRTGIKQQQVSRWRKSLADADRYRKRLILAARRQANLASAANHRAEGTGDNEWFTPAEYIEAARTVMGEIDLDPASHEKAQATVQALSFFTAADDGLRQDWHGRVWLNPPYVQPLIAEFTGKLVREVNAQRVSEAILLTHNYTDTVWFHYAESAAALLCFTRGRIRFVDADGEECAPTQGQCFFYYGPNRERFCDAFARFGFIR